jgi:uncharacterized membrane protein
MEHDWTDYLKTISLIRLVSTGKKNFPFSPKIVYTHAEVDRMINSWEHLAAAMALPTTKEIIDCFITSLNLGTLSSSTIIVETQTVGTGAGLSSAKESAPLVSLHSAP